MKLIVPLGGRGSRMQPHSLHRPKSLLRLAGATVLDHVLAALEGLEPSGIVFIVGPDGDPIRDWARRSLEIEHHFVEQPEPEGQAQAIALAREHLAGELLIVFADTLFAIDPAAFQTARRRAPLPDGLLFVQEVEDPSALGVARVDDDGRVLELIEKPETPVSKLAVMGLYYLREGASLLGAIDGLMAEGRRTKGEFYLADALQDMIEAGARFLALPVEAWWECGTVPDSIAAQRFLLERGLGPAGAEAGSPGTWGPKSRLIPPVHIGEGVRVTDSVIGPHVHLEAGCEVVRSRVGPHVSVDAGARVTRARVRDTIIGAAAAIEDSELDASILGPGAEVAGLCGSANLGDASQVRARRA